MLYRPNDALTYEDEPLVAQNVFLHREKECTPLPAFEDYQERLPRVVWDGHADALDCYDAAWRIAYSNLRAPKPDDQMVANYIDTAFNGFLFMWDSSFITLFGNYGRRGFDFQKTLDNIYAHQHRDGFICREICEAETGDQFYRFDPSSTGPNVLAWAEWEHYLLTENKVRIAEVFAPLLAYHRWLMKHRTWPDGSYFGTGWATGMDNQPRVQAGYNHSFSHGHQVWADVCLQQILNAKMLQNMAALLGRTQEIEDIAAEAALLTDIVNTHLWDDDTAFYYDLWRDGRLNGVKSIGAYWALLAGVVPPEKLHAFIAHLDDEKAFNRPHRVPSLSYEHPEYQAQGDYWRGGVWAPTNYMVMRGLEKAGHFDLAREIAQNHLQNVLAVYCQTGTLYENYAPEYAAPGIPAKPDFVGWTGLPPVAVLIEYIFGIRVEGSHITWRIRCTQRHGVENLPILNGTVTLLCPEHGAEKKPAVLVCGDVSLTVDILWEDGTAQRIEK